MRQFPFNFIHLLRDERLYLCSVWIGLLKKYQIDIHIDIFLDFLLSRRERRLTYWFLCKNERPQNEEPVRYIFFYTFYFSGFRILTMFYTVIIIIIIFLLKRFFSLKIPCLHFCLSERNVAKNLNQIVLCLCWSTLIAPWFCATTGIWSFEIEAKFLLHCVYSKDWYYIRVVQWLMDGICCYNFCNLLHSFTYTCEIHHKDQNQIKSQITDWWKFLISIFNFQYKLLWHKIYSTVFFLLLLSLHLTSLMSFEMMTFKNCC